jgi:hypothetical protein
MLFFIKLDERIKAVLMKPVKKDEVIGSVDGLIRTEQRWANLKVSRGFRDKKRLEKRNDYTRDFWFG